MSLPSHIVIAFVCILTTHSELVEAQIILHPGIYRKICPSYTTALGGNPTATGGTGSLSYSWQPTVSLNNPNVPDPIASPSLTTIYTLTVKDSLGRQAKDTVTVYVLPTGYVYAGKDTVINQGQTITLHGSAPASIPVEWGSVPQTSNIDNINSLNPDVFPTTTTTFVIAAIFPNGCIGTSEVIVKVIPGSNLYFFNAFSPNGDGDNDVFYIGNIEQYPNNVLEVFNRYGMKVLSKTGYTNDWDGKYLNTDLPGGTYFYILDTKTAAGKFKGSVTLVK